MIGDATGMGGIWTNEYADIMMAALELWKIATSQIKE
jgi:hypothetical protein